MFWNRSWCKVCSLQYNRSRNLQTKYNLTDSEYNALLQDQGGSCLICRDTAGSRMLAVDHEHDTGRVRGLLCSPCNTALGLFKDSPELLRLAADYLEQKHIHPYDRIVLS